MYYPPARRSLVRQVPCPKCSAAAGSPCAYAKGERQRAEGANHAERLQAWRQTPEGHVR